MEKEYTIPDLTPFFLLLLLGGLGCADRGVALGELCRLAGERVEVASAADVELTTVTKLGFGEERLGYSGRVLRVGGQERVETWRDSAASSWGYVELWDGERARVWTMDKFGWDAVDVVVPLQHRQLQRWFEMPAVDRGGAWIDGVETVEGRRCHVVRIPTGLVDGQQCYQLRGTADPAGLAAIRDGGTLRPVVVEVEGGGRVEAYSRDSMLAWEQDDRLGAPDTRIRAWAVESEPLLLLSPMSLPGDVEHGDMPRVGGFLSSFEVFTGLWIDRELGVPVKAEGILRDPRFGHRLDAALVWSDFREVAGAGVLPHRQELRIDGRAFAVTEVTAAVAGAAAEPALFEPASISRTLDGRSQDNNEASVEGYIEAGTHDGTETEDDGDPYALARDRVFQPEALVDLLDIESGSHVADVGAGTGYFTFRLARATGPRGRVYAVDVNPHAVAFVEQRSGDPRLDPHGNVRGVVNRFDDVALPADSVDLVFACWVFFHRFQFPTEETRAMLASMATACRSGGRLVVIAERPEASRVVALPVGVALLEISRKGSEIEDVASAQPLVSPEGVDPPRVVQGKQAMTTAAHRIRANYEAAGFEFVTSREAIEGHDLLEFRKP